MASRAESKKKKLESELVCAHSLAIGIWIRIELGIGIGITTLALGKPFRRPGCVSDGKCECLVRVRAVSVAIVSVFTVGRPLVVAVASAGWALDPALKHWKRVACQQQLARTLSLNG